MSFIFPLAAISIDIPLFNGESSYISYETLQDAFAMNFLTVEINPKSLTGLILFNGGSFDYIAILLRDGLVELHYDLNNSPTQVVSSSPITLYEWHTIEVIRKGPQGQLVVDDSLPVSSTSKQGTMLQISDYLYLGGIVDYSLLPDELDMETGFAGCIRNLTVSQSYVPVDLISSAIGGADVSDCSDALACLNDPCQNSVACTNEGFDSSFTCTCLVGYTGETCDSVVTECVDPGACSNGGECFPEVINNTLVDSCVCSLPYGGDSCNDSEFY